MVARNALIALGLPFVVALLGCGVQYRPEGDGPAGSSQQPIINGTSDQTHDAVVAVLGNSSECTGTIIYKDVANKKGYVLTAAHCMEEAPQVVVRGTNYVNGVQYPVIDYKAHEQYNGSVYDFAMVTFTWNNNEPPVIPATTKAQDDLAAGSTVDFVGYGVTESNQNNSIRMHISGELDSMTSLTIHYNQSNSGQFANNGGPCFGDSGGPALYNVPGVGETVAGVTSYGDQNCTQFGVSSRVSAVEAWINDYLMNGGGGGAQTCDQCFEASTSNGGACSGKVDACVNDPPCLALVQCLNNCQSQACADGCVQNNPNGVDGYVAILTCVCDTGCPAECGNEQFCQGSGGPMCGFTADASCQSCFEGGCCAQGNACADDPSCVDCFTDPNADPSCIDTNIPASQFYQCLAAKCADECGIDTGGGGAGGGGPGGSGAGAGGGGVGAGGPGGNGAGAGDAGGDGGDAGKRDNDDVAVDSGCGQCRVGADGGTTSNGGLAFAMSALVMGLFGARRKRR